MSQKPLSLDYIKEHTLYTTTNIHVMHLIGSYKDLLPIADDEISPASASSQPEELQPFYKAYRKAYQVTRDVSLLDVDTFYRKWSENPKQFEPVKRTPVGKLHDYLNKIYDGSNKGGTTDVIINNYDNETLGNHRLSNFVNALSALGPSYDFDVVEYQPVNPKDAYSYDKILVQEDDEEKIRKLGSLANDYAVSQSFLSYDPFRGRKPVPFYEEVKDAKGLNRVHGIAVVDGRAVDVSMKSTYGNHEFTHDEIVSLFSGEEILIPDFQTKSGEKKDIRGKLGEQSYMGNKFYGLIRTDLSSEKRKGVSLVMDDDKESERVLDC